MKIGELGAKIGVDAETIRYYERRGLLSLPARSSNGYREYGPGHAERLAFIRHCRALDMSLDEVEVLLSFVESPSRSCAHIDHLVDDQLARLRARLKSMRALERQLLALRLRCKSRQATKKCGILSELVAAAHGEACVCHGVNPLSLPSASRRRPTSRPRNARSR